MKKFWLVWRAGTTPVAKHDSWESAEAEAKRLALANPGTYFYCLEAISYSQASTPVTTVKLGL